MNRINGVNGTINTEQKDDSKKKKFALIILLLLLLLGLFAGGAYLYKKLMPQPTGSIVIQNGEENADKKKNPLDGLYVTYSGITDATIEERSVVELKNLEENGDIIMKFEVYEGSKLVFSSDYIKSGEHINWEAGKDLSVGEHVLTVKQTPQIEVDGEFIPLTTGSCECTLKRI